ncbi:MAG TPA: stage III sporulation protein AA [Limnochordales bacterium]
MTVSHAALQAGGAGERRGAGSGVAAASPQELVVARRTVASHEPGVGHDADPIDRDIAPYLPPRLRPLITGLPVAHKARLVEIRLRVGRPLAAVLQGEGPWFIGPQGLVRRPAAAEPVTPDDGARLLAAISQSSVYALEDAFRQGYVTLPGGHRVGFCGEAVVDGAVLRTWRHVASFNIRIARAVPGAADAVLPRLVAPGGRIRHTLVVSPPACGKTTLLRDLARQISWGVPSLNLPGQEVAIVDERSEIAACRDGVPQHDVGPRTDVSDRCPKALGMLLMVRAMAPRVLVTDELGTAADAAAVLEALHAGVSVIASAHGASWEEVAGRPALGPLVEGGAFERAVILSRRRGPGTVEAVLDLPQRAGGPARLPQSPRPTVKERS